MTRSMHARCYGVHVALRESQFFQLVAEIRTGRVPKPYSAHHTNEWGAYPQNNSISANWISRDGRFVALMTP